MNASWPRIPRRFQGRERLWTPWTRARARASGYSSDGRCPLCGQPDSVRHRAWQCQHPEVVAVRLEAAGGNG
eukprot:8752677-Pyramimonas_sp.AAC.1